MSDGMMRAARIHDYGGPEQIKIEQVPCPEPGEGQVRVRLQAAGVNPADWKMRAGLFKQFSPLPMPWIPGLEGAGIVDKLGPGVTAFRPGQPVFGPFNNSYAEYVVASEKDVFGKPDRLSFEEAASVPVGSLTAWQAVIEEAQVKPGDRVLVHGGAGGVGLYAVQLAKWKGANVTATASAANQDLLRSLGADTAIDYARTQFEDIVKDVDVVIDTVGGDLATRSFQVIKPGGIYVTVAGRFDPEEAESRGIRATGSRRADTTQLKQIIELIESGQVKPVVGQVLSLDQAREAHELSQTGHGAGRIILKIE